MSFIGDFFHGIGNLLTGHSFGHKDSDGQQPTAPEPVKIAAPQAAAPTETPAPQQGQQGARPGAVSMTPSFLAAAALPNQSAGGGMSSNVGGKSLLGQ